MDIFSKTSLFPKKHHRCISLESGQTSAKKSYPKTPLDAPRFWPRRYSTPELAMRKHTLRQRDGGGGGGTNELPISNKSCQTDILGLDKYLQRSPPADVSLGPAGRSTAAAVVFRAYKKPSKKPKVRSVAVHCERRRLTVAAFKGCQKFKHVYKRKISLPAAAQPSWSATTSTDDGDRRAGNRRPPDGGVLPRLRPDRTDAVADRPAATKVGPAVKLPRIPTRDAKPDRVDEGRHTATRLARMRQTRPQSTGGSSSAGCSGADAKLAAYFRARSAPKVHSQYLSRPEAPERGPSTTPGSSDAADTALDARSFVKRQRPADATTAKTVGTRTVSTSTTFVEPVFPIVFSCESILRHPLDGGYVSHTESHRFSFHYVPAKDVDSSDRSSLVFASSSACRNEQRLTGDSMSVTLQSDKPDEPSTGTSDAATGERRLVVEHLNAGVRRFEARDDGATTPIPDETNPNLTDGKTTLENHESGGVVRIEGIYVLGKGDAVNQPRPNEYEKSVAVSAMTADKTIDNTNGKARGAAESHAHVAGDTLLLLANEQNYERLAQNRPGDDSDRTVLNQSPKFDGVETRLSPAQRQRDLESVEDDVRYTESDSSRTKAELAKITTNAESTERPKHVEKPIERSTNPETTRRHNKTPTDDRNSDLAESLESYDGNSTDMAPHGRKHRGTESDRAGVADNGCDQSLRAVDDRRRFDYRDESVKRDVPNRICDNISRTRDEGQRRDRTARLEQATTLSNAADCRPFYGRSTGGRVADVSDVSRRTDHRVNYACSRCAREGIRADAVPNESAEGDRPRDDNRTGPQCAAAAMSKRRLESVDEAAEAKESADDYVGGFLFGDAYYKKRPQKYETNDDDDDGRRKYEYYSGGAGGDSKKVNFPPGPDDRRYGYYRDYAPKTGHGPWDEDCTVFAETRPPGDAQRASYYSQLDGGDAGGTDDCKNCTDSDESLTDSLEDSGGGGKCGDGTTAAVSYFLALNGRESAAVTFTLKMPGALVSRLNRRRSLLKKHLHAPAAARKTPTRVRTRHKGCQTLWTEEKGVQVQRGSTACRGRGDARGKLHAVDDRSVLETLLAGLHERSRVSENQIRVVAGQKMVSEGNQTEQRPQPEQPKQPCDRRTQTRTTRDAAAGPETADGNAGVAPGGQTRGQPVKKFSSDNALMVGVVRQNRYKGKEAVDGAKNDQLVTLSKGWINFYTLRADSLDTDLHEAHENDDGVEPVDDRGQQFTVHVQAVPEPVTSLPVVHAPNRNAVQLSKTSTTCSAAAKHLPRLVQTVANAHHRCPSHLGTANSWCVSVDGPNNMHMKVSLMPEKSDVKAPENFDPNEDQRLQEACRRSQALQRKNNFGRRPYRAVKRTQSTPRDVLSADVSRTESALSAESKYIETINTQLLIHKARRRLSQEWDARNQNGAGVAESVQLVVTGDSVSSRTQHYATRGHHQHCSFRRQSRRI